MKSVVATGKTVDEAITSALVRLGVTKSQAEIRVLSEPVKGLFGFIGGKVAEVEVFIRQSPEESASLFLKNVLTHMGIETSVGIRQVVNSDQSLNFCLDVECSDELLPIVIGKHGATLDSLQYLVNVVANRTVYDRESYVKFYVDAGFYRDRRKESLYRIAERAALKAIKSGKPVILEPMSASDRKIVHTCLQARTDVSTVSEGVEPHRRVKIIPNDNDE